MKKIVSSIVLLGGVALLFSGCGKEEEKLMTCTLTQKDVVNNYELNSTYEVNYQGDVVKNVTSKEEITSSDTTVLSNFETQLKEIYQTMDDNYGGYDINVTNDGAKVTSIVKINYQKLDLKKLIEDNSAMKNYVNKNNQLTVNGIKTMYQAQGISCK